MNEFKGQSSGKCEVVDNIYEYTWNSALRKYPSIRNMFENEDDFESARDSYLDKKYVIGSVWEYYDDSPVMIAEGDFNDKTRNLVCIYTHKGGYNLPFIREAGEPNNLTEDDYLYDITNASLEMVDIHLKEKLADSLDEYLSEVR